MKQISGVSDYLWAIAKKIILICALLVVLLPMLWLVTTSFKHQLDIFKLPPKIIFKPTLQNYVDSASKTGIYPRYKNTVIVALGTSVFCMAVGSLSAYALARARFWGATLLSYIILASRLVPPMVIIVPLFLVFRKVGLFDTYIALILAYSTFVLPFVVWLMRGYFQEIPESIDEMAMIDGCSRVGAFLRIVVPCSLPGIVATTVFTVILCWNEFLMALVLTSMKATTIPVAITTLMHDLQRGGVVWGALAAVGTLTVLPVLVLGLSVQKVMARGLTMGATKG